jgi:hypothetical protein
VGGGVPGAPPTPAPMILIFSTAMGADFSLYVKTIETQAHAFLALNILAISSVY